MTTITLEMPDEVRAVIDEARGNQDVATFLLTVGERAARRRVARRSAPDELTPADHIRMADEAERSAVPLAESRRRVFARIDAEEAAARQ